jgi:cytochrome c-type biogenesis protein CcmE
VKPKHKRLSFVVIGIGLIAAAAALGLSASRETLVFFHTPTEIAERTIISANRRLRIGGLVEDGSVRRGAGDAVSFRITDLDHAVAVRYRGILPDLFREGQGVVAEGRLVDGVFEADQVLAKHDENYMPPEAAEALKRSGRWQHMGRQMGERMQGDGEAPAPGAGR